MKKRLRPIPASYYIFLVIIVGLVSYFGSHYKDEVRKPAAKGTINLD